MNFPTHAIHEEQQSLILQAAVECIEASSLLDFTIAAIANRAGLSIVYKHIQNKQDVLVAPGIACTAFGHLARRLMALPLPIAGRMIIANQLLDARHAYPRTR